MIKKKKSTSNAMSFLVDDDSDDSLPPVVPKKKKKASTRTIEDYVDVEVKDVTPKKKIKVKKKPSTALTVTLPKLKSNGTRRISKADADGKLNSILGDDAESLMQLLENGDADSAITRLNKRLIQTVIDLIPEVETNIRESKGRYGVHSFNGLVQTIRELVIDLQSAQDRGAMGEAMVEKLIRPAFLDLATDVVKEYSMVQSDMQSIMPHDQFLEFRRHQLESRDRIAKALQDKYVDLQEKIISFLQR